MSICSCDVPWPGLCQVSGIPTQRQHAQARPERIRKKKSRGSARTAPRERRGRAYVGRARAMGPQLGGGMGYRTILIRRDGGLASRRSVKFALCLKRARVARATSALGSPLRGTISPADRHPTRRMHAAHVLSYAGGVTRILYAGESGESLRRPGTVSAVVTPALPWTSSACATGEGAQMAGAGRHQVVSNPRPTPSQPPPPPRAVNPRTQQRKMSHRTDGGQSVLSDVWAACDCDARKPAFRMADLQVRPAPTRAPPLAAARGHGDWQATSQTLPGARHRSGPHMSLVSGGLGKCTTPTRPGTV